MKNILNIMKYSFNSLKLLYFIEAIIIGIGLVVSMLISRFTGGLDTLVLVSLIATMNFVAHIILFAKQLSKDNGNLLFLAPIKGIEFIVGNLFEMAIINLVVVAIMSIINYKGLNFGILVTNISISIEFISIYLVITALIGIIAPYIRNKFLSVITIIILSSVGSGIYNSFIWIVSKVTPYVYMTIGKNNTIEIDLIEVAIGIVAIIFLQILAARSIDKKLDII